MRTEKTLAARTESINTDHNQFESNNCDIYEIHAVHTFLPFHCGYKGMVYQKFFRKKRFSSNGATNPKFNQNDRKTCHFAAYIYLPFDLLMKRVYLPCASRANFPVSLSLSPSHPLVLFFLFFFLVFLFLCSDDFSKHNWSSEPLRRALGNASSGRRFADTLALSANYTEKIHINDIQRTVRFDDIWQEVKGP